MELLYEHQTYWGREGSWANSHLPLTETLQGRANVKEEGGGGGNNPRKKQKQHNLEATCSKGPKQVPAVEWHCPELLIKVKVVKNCKEQMNLGVLGNNGEGLWESF